MDGLRPEVDRNDVEIHFSAKQWQPNGGEPMQIILTDEIIFVPVKELRASLTLDPNTNRVQFGRSLKGGKVVHYSLLSKTEMPKGYFGAN